MNLLRLAVENYTVFPSSTFDLACTPDQPIVVFSGNNGAGKTSLLEAFRLVFHGRRSYLTGISDADYIATIRAKFHKARFDRDCSISLCFEFSEFGRIRPVEIRRSWSARANKLAEDVSLSVDGSQLPHDDVDDFLSSLVPPEILKYFFFDGEQIKELAEWRLDEEGDLFAAIDELLGLGLIDQLERDLDRVSTKSEQGAKGPRLAALLEQFEAEECVQRTATEQLKAARLRHAVATRAYDGAKQRFLELGGLFADEREAKQRHIDDIRHCVEALEDELRREGSSYLPLIAMHRTRDALLGQVDVAIKLESVEAVSTVFDESRARLREALLNVGLQRAKLEKGVDAVRKALVPRPIVISRETPSLSLREASWIQSVLSKDVPKLRDRVTEIVREHRSLSSQLAKLQRQVSQTPTNDPKTDIALKYLEKTHEETIATGADLAIKQESLRMQILSVATIKSQLKKQRLIAFQEKRFSNKDRLITALRSALPDYGRRLKLAREAQFGSLLGAALQRLWHKKDRVDEVLVDFAGRSIRLMQDRSEINRSALSAAEKQLFATAFIYAVAKLSNRSLPFVIDTPVGRLDKRHRRNLVIDFLPTMSHQVILFSTDTEIVGPLLRELRPLIAKEHDLANYNGGITEPVQLEVAL